MMKRLIFFIPLAFGLITTSCLKDPLDDLSDEETWIYKTTEAVNANYNQYKTFTIVDSVTHFEGSGPEKRAYTNYDLAAKNEIIQNMQERNYQYVETFTDANKPDLVINLTKVNVTTAYIYAGWYDWYYTYGWYWFYPYYPGYYYPTYFVDYDVYQAYLIDMVDTKAYNQNTQVLPSTVWHASLMGYNIFASQVPVVSFVDQAFAQTPSLITTN